MRSLALCLTVLATVSAPVMAQDITSARLTDATGRYDHGVLGDALEWGGLELSLSDGKRLKVTLPESRVFEDVEARLGDFDGDGRAEVMVVETNIATGGSLAIYDQTGKRAATDHIGQTHRWLAPAGWGDFDGDGRTEIAYVDRPHLARELVFLQLDGNKLTEIARLKGVTNHRIGDNRISGGVRRCDGKDSLILATADWQSVVEVTLTESGPKARQVKPLRSARDFDRARTCP